jgi:hypothetical protein
MIHITGPLVTFFVFGQQIKAKLSSTDLLGSFSQRAILEQQIKSSRKNSL